MVHVGYIHFCSAENIQLVHATVAIRGALVDWKVHHQFQNQLFSCQAIMGVV